MKGDPLADAMDVVELAERLGYKVSMIEITTDETPAGGRFGPHRGGRTKTTVSIRVHVYREHDHGDGFDNPYRIK